MIEFIATYWLEFVFGLIATGSIAAAKRFRDLYKKEQNHKKEAEYDDLKKEIKDELLEVIEKNKEEAKNKDYELKQYIHTIDNDIRILKKGILAIHGNAFKQTCHKLLEQDTISLEQWDALNQDHEIYNSLGGNHDGDRLYQDVSIKYRAQLDG